MKSFLRFFIKLGVESPTNNVVNVNSNSTPLSKANKELLSKDCIGQLKAFSEKFNKGGKVAYAVDELIKFHNTFILKKINNQTNDFVLKKINKSKINLSDDNQAFILKSIKDIYFYSFLFFNKKNKPDWLIDLINILKKVEIVDMIESYGTVIPLTEVEVNKINTVVINTNGKQFSIRGDEQIKKVVLDKWNSVNEAVELMCEISGKDEQLVRESLSALIFDLKQETQQHFNILPTLLKNMFEVLAPVSKNKQTVYTCMHEVFEPFFPSLHNEDEYWSNREYTVKEPRRFKQHQRDTLDSLMTVKKLKFFRS